MAIARQDLLALVAAACCWGGGTVISKAALTEIPPLTLLPIQLAASLAALAALLRWRRAPIRAEAPPLLGRLGLLNPGLAYALSLLGLATISASLSVLIWVLEPLMILVLAGWFLRERITASLVALTLVAVAGMAIVVFDPSAGSDQLVGVALTLAGVACCAVYTIIARRWLPMTEQTGQVLLAQQAYALVLAIALVAIVGLIGGRVLPTTLSAMGLASAVGSGVLYYAAAYWFYLGALRRVPASRALVAFYLVPIAGVIAASLVLGERLEPWQWVGAALVLFSVAATASRSEPAQASVPVFTTPGA